MTASRPPAATSCQCIPLAVRSTVHVAPCGPATVTPVRGPAARAAADFILPRHSQRLAKRSMCMTIVVASVVGAGTSPSFLASAASCACPFPTCACASPMTTCPTPPASSRCARWISLRIRPILCSELPPRLAGRSRQKLSFVLHRFRKASVLDLPIDNVMQTAGLPDMC